MLRSGDWSFPAGLRLKHGPNYTGVKYSSKRNDRNLFVFPSENLSCFGRDHKAIIISYIFPDYRTEMSIFLKHLLCERKSLHLLFPLLFSPSSQGENQKEKNWVKTKGLWKTWRWWAQIVAGVAPIAGAWQFGICESIHRSESNRAFGSHHAEASTWGNMPSQLSCSWAMREPIRIPTASLHRGNLKSKQLFC